MVLKLAVFKPTVPHCSAKRYSSIVAAARCSFWLVEQRTTRPLQWTRTSWGVPRTECGIRMENRMSMPTLNALSSENRTPLAEMFRVRAAISPFPVDSTTGSARGNRTAQRTSWRPAARATAPGGSGTSGLRELIRTCLYTTGLICKCSGFYLSRTEHQSFQRGNLFSADSVSSATHRRRIVISASSESLQFPCSPRCLSCVGSASRACNPQLLLTENPRSRLPS
jgi:hypothetical protein